MNNNPWKDCIEGKREPESYRSIADSDYAIIIDIIKDEINHYLNGILSEKHSKFYKQNILNYQIKLDFSRNSEKLGRVIDNSMIS